jgi:pyruvate dehydrogenase E2 component (dihydrolipoamide acetyltransferase)
MATEIKLPELGENIEGGEVVEIKVAPGTEVSEGQALLEVEAEKSTVDVPSPMAGRITELLVKKGDQVKTGQVLCRIEPGAGKKDQKAPVAARPAAPPKPAPEEKPARPPERQEKKPAPPPAPAPEAVPPRTGDGRKQAAEVAPPVTPGSGKLVPAGPATRRLARELGIDLSQVAGSARGGRVTPEDVKAHVRDLASGTAGRGAAPGVGAPPLPNF